MSSRKYKVPTGKALVCKVVLELVALVLLAYPMIHIYVYLQGNREPYLRGFFCDDESLKHPNIPEEISVGECVLIWSAIVGVFVILVESLHFTVYEFPHWEEEIRRRSASIRFLIHCLDRIPAALFLIELYRVMGYFAIGALCSLLTTELAKYKVGRLRPYFLTVCGIELTDQLCKDIYGYNIFVTNYTCPGDDYQVREARKSFLSGHSSFSFYCATFLIVYLQARLTRRQLRDSKKRHNRRAAVLFLRGFKVLRPFLQFGCFALAFYIALTRVSDFKHHSTDIIAGIIVGFVIACIVLFFLMDLFGRPRSFEEKDDEFGMICQYHHHHLHSCHDEDNSAVPKRQETSVIELEPAHRHVGKKKTHKNDAKAPIASLDTP